VPARPKKGKKGKIKSDHFCGNLETDEANGAQSTCRVRIGGKLEGSIAPDRN
jgi:hypothetical protein